MLHLPHVVQSPQRICCSLWPPDKNEAEFELSLEWVCGNTGQMRGPVCSGATSLSGAKSPPTPAVRLPWGSWPPLPSHTSNISKATHRNTPSSAYIYLHRCFPTNPSMWGFWGPSVAFDDLAAPLFKIVNYEMNSPKKQITVSKMISFLLFFKRSLKVNCFNKRLHKTNMSAVFDIHQYYLLSSMLAHTHGSLMLVCLDFEALS